jgi:hypothetical protein
MVWHNWKEPYRGIGQTLLQRTVSTGLYFPLEDACTAAFGNSLLGGQAAGILNAMVLNPLALIKYQTWGADESRSLLRQARRMYRDRGIKIFLRGTTATAARDGVFGGCFAIRRCLTEEQDTDGITSFAISVGCAVIGTVVSSPFNYIRNMAYAAETNTPLESLAAKQTFWRHVLDGLAKEARDQSTFVKRLKHLGQRLRLGWGTTRVAVGMAITDRLYRGCVSATNTD